MFAVEITVAAPVVSSFTTFAEVTGLQPEISPQAPVVRTIDSTGTRQALREIDGVLYSAKGNTLFETSVATGATQSRTLNPLPGSDKVEVRDIAQFNSGIVIVGASLTDKVAPDGAPRPTVWNLDGIPSAIGPAGVTGKAIFTNASAGIEIIGGYYKNASGEYTSWIHSDSGDYDLPGSANPLAEQTITGSSSSGYYLSGYETNTPMFWSSAASPDAGNFELFLSPESPMLYPDGAVLGSAGKKFRIVEDPLNLISIFGQYDKPVLNQDQVVIGYQPHAGIWSITGDPEYDFGANTEMLGVIGLGNLMVVAHGNSISLVYRTNTISVQTLPLNSLLPELPAAGTTTRILDNGLMIIGDPDQAIVGINYAETSGGITQNKLLIRSLRIPRQLDIDAEDDGVFDGSSIDFDMTQPSFEPSSYGTKTLRARVIYSDSSTVDAVTTYESLPFEARQLEGQNVLQVGGTTGNDAATLKLLGPGNYRAMVGGQTRDFTNIDSVLVRLGNGEDSLTLTGGMVVDLQTLTGIETIDATDSEVQTINQVDALSVSLQVQPERPLLIKANPDDIIDLLSDWKVELPQLTDNRPTAKLTLEGYTLLLQNGLFTNPFDNLDVTFDGFITALDALVVINHINQSGAGLNPAVEAYLDVNANGSVTALDVLLVINHINTVGAGEGESSLQTAATFDGLADHRWLPTAVDLEAQLPTGKRRTP